MAWWKQKSRQRGSGLIVVMVLLVVMAVYMAANTTQLDRLRRTLDGVEKQQVQRIAPRPGAEPPASKR